MPRGLVCLPLVLLIAPVSAAPVPKAKPVEPYFPTAVGTKWVYQRESGKLFVEVVTAVTEKDGEKSVVIQVGPDTGSWDETYTVTNAEVVLRTTGPFKMDECRLRLPLKEMDSWEFGVPIQQGLKCDSGKTTVGKAEKVEVPAGTFEAVPVVSETTAVDGKAIPTPEKCTRWYAAGVGMVKIEYAGGHRVLKEFTPAKK